MTTEHKNTSIHWDIDYSVAIGIHDQEFHYSATGKGENQVDYQGTAVCCCGEIEIIDVEEA